MFTIKFLNLLCILEAIRNKILKSNIASATLKYVKHDLMDRWVSNKTNIVKCQLQNPGGGYMNVHCNILATFLNV